MNKRSKSETRWDLGTCVPALHDLGVRDLQSVSPHPTPLVTTRHGSERQELGWSWGCTALRLRLRLREVNELISFLLFVRMKHVTLAYSTRGVPGRWTRHYMAKPTRPPRRPGPKPTWGPSPETPLYTNATTRHPLILGWVFRHCVCSSNGNACFVRL